jgi:hypothetical protein
MLSYLLVRNKMDSQELIDALAIVKLILINNLHNIKSLRFSGHWNGVSLTVNDIKIFRKNGLYEEVSPYFGVIDIIKDLLPRMDNLTFFGYDNAHDTYYPDNGSHYGPPLYMNLKVPPSLTEFESDTIRSTISFGGQLTKIKCTHFHDTDFLRGATNLKEFECCLMHNDKVEEFLHDIKNGPTPNVLITFTNKWTIRALKGVINNFPHTVNKDEKYNFVFYLI